MKVGAQGCRTGSQYISHDEFRGSSINLGKGKRSFLFLSQTLDSQSQKPCCTAHFGPGRSRLTPSSRMIAPKLGLGFNSALQGFFSALCSPGSSRPGGLCPAEVSVPALRGLFSALQGILSCPAGFLSCPAEVSFLPCPGVSFLPCVFPFHPQGVFISALQVFFALQGFLFPALQGFFPALLGLLFCPAEVSFLPCWGFFSACRVFCPRVSFWHCRGFFPVLQGLLFCPPGFLSCPAGVSFLPCRGFFPALQGYPFHPEEGPRRTAGVTSCVSFPPSRGFLFCSASLFCPAGVSFSCPAGFLSCPAGVSFLPCRGFFPALLGFLFCLQGFLPKGFFLALQGFLSCPAGASFLPSRVSFLPCWGFFSALQGCLSLQGFLLILCRSHFLTLRGFPFCPVCFLSTPKGFSFLLCKSFLPCGGFFSCPAGFFSCPTGASSLPCGGFFSALPAFLFHPAGHPVQGACAVWKRNPAQGGKGTLHRVEKEPGWKRNPAQGGKGTRVEKEPCTGWKRNPAQGGKGTLHRVESLHRVEKEP